MLEMLNSLAQGKGPESESESNSETFRLPAFDNVDPIGPWIGRSCAEHVICCLIEAYAAPLNGHQSKQLQQHFESDGKNTNTVLSYLLRWCEVDYFRHSNTAQLVEHLRSGYPVMAIVRRADAYHFFMISGYSTNSLGAVESWEIHDIGNFSSPLSDKSFQAMWREADNRAVLIRPTGSPPTTFETQAQPGAFPFVNADPLANLSRSALAKTRPPATPTMSPYSGAHFTLVSLIAIPLYIFVVHFLPMPPCEPYRESQ